MKIELKNNHNVYAELIIESSSATIKEDISNFKGKIEGTEQEQLISAALEITRFNGGDDVDFVDTVISQCLNSSEIERLVDNLNKLINPPLHS